LKISCENLKKKHDDMKICNWRNNCTINYLRKQFSLNNIIYNIFKQVVIFCAQFVAIVYTFPFCF